MIAVNTVPALAEKYGNSVFASLEIRHKVVFEKIASLGSIVVMTDVEHVLIVGTDVIVALSRHKNLVRHLYTVDVEFEKTEADNCDFTFCKVFGCIDVL